MRIKKDKEIIQENIQDNKVEKIKESAVKFKGIGQVWDASKNKLLCEFPQVEWTPTHPIEQVLEVSDPRTIKIMRELGYKEV